MTTKSTKFGPQHINKQTPKWARMMFKITVAATSAASILVASSTLIPAGSRVEAMLWIKSLDAFMLGISQMFGVEERAKFRSY